MSPAATILVLSLAACAFLLYAIGKKWWGLSFWLTVALLAVAYAAFSGAMSNLTTWWGSP